MSFLKALAVTAVVVLSACGAGGPSEPGARLSPAARNYLEAALDTMQRYSVNRTTIDWPALRATALARAGSAQTTADTYGALDAALAALGDHHSFLARPGTVSTSPGFKDPAPTPTNVPSGRILGNRIAYVLVPAFAGTNPQGRADSTVTVIRTLDAAAPCGWVVDLRVNSGGNYAPMVAGLAPLFGDARLGEFVFPDGSRLGWYTRAGTFGVVTSDGVEWPMLVPSAPYTLRSAAPPIAVLYSASTASSGEAVAISFRGMPTARSFGQPTAGLTSANRSWTLDDGATLVLTVAVDADRTGRIYGGKLDPDELAPVAVVNPQSPDMDAGQVAAVQWLSAQPECSVALAAHAQTLR